MPEDQREQLLYEFFADECALAGADNVAVILGGTYKPIQAEHGENMPVVELVAFVVGTVGFIDATLSLYDRWRTNTPGSKTNVDFVALARSELQIPEDIDDEVITRLLERIASQR